MAHNHTNPFYAVVISKEALCAWKLHIRVKVLIIGANLDSDNERTQIIMCGEV